MFVGRQTTQTTKIHSRDARHFLIYLSISAGRAFLNQKIQEMKYYIFTPIKKNKVFVDKLREEYSILETYEGGTVDVTVIESPVDSVETLREMLNEYPANVMYFALGEQDGQHTKNAFYFI